MVLPPKRPMSAYACFLKRFRNQLKKKGERTTFLEFTQRAQDKWRTMTPREKKKYIKISEKDRDRYEVEKRGRRRGNKNAPKRPITAFFHYIKEKGIHFKKQHPLMPQHQIVQALASKWRNLKEKLPYEVMAVQDRGRYYKEMAIFNKKELVRAKKAEPAATSRKTSSEQEDSDDSDNDDFP